jgi:predicted RNase H-like nuclease
MYVVGIDGCPGGWIAVAYDPASPAAGPRFHPSIADAIASYPDALRIAVDIPIGLTIDGPRPCDVAARRVLGPRRSSVFPAPDPRVIDAATYDQTAGLSRSLTGKGISKQGYAIYSKVAEANRAVTPLLQERVIEVHPEVSFWALNAGRPMAYHKSLPEGYQERRVLLEEALGLMLPNRDEARKLARPASADDFLDAVVAAWSGLRAANGEGRRLPEDPPVGTNGLRMEIWY